MRLIDQAIPSSVQYEDTLHQIAALDCRRYFTASDGRNPHPYSGEVPYANASANDNAV
jgi:hypothetical protein